MDIKKKGYYFHSFLPVNNQTTTNITAITSRICINAPTPGKAKKPTNQSITRMTTIVNNVFIAKILLNVKFGPKKGSSVFSLTEKLFLEQ
jgi:hypothetical protein